MESFKEQIDKKKKFKLSGKKTQVILHVNPTFDRSDVGYGYTSKKGSPPSKGGRSSARFGEGRVDNRILSFREDIDVDELFTRQGKHASPSLANYNPDRIRKSRSELEKLKAKLRKPQKRAVQLAAGLTGSDHRMKMLDKLKTFDKKRTDAGKKPIFKDDKKKPKPLPWYAQGTLTSRAPRAEEVDPHIKTMIANGDSDEKIKKMHPKITNDELKKLREQVDLVH